MKDRLLPLLALLLIPMSCSHEGGTAPDRAQSPVARSPLSASDREAIIRDLHIKDPNRNPYLTFDEWMAQAPAVPGHLSPERRAALNRAWATFWIDTLPADGAWIHPIICPGEKYSYGIWLWDTGFHVLGLQYGGPKARQLALWQIEVVLNGQHESGKIPRETWPKGAQFFGEGIQAPGILTLAANRLYEVAETPAEKETVRAALEKFYPRLVRNHEWFFTHTDKGRGLCWWEKADSGWDNTPRWDAPGVREALDLNCFLYLDRRNLAAMARTLGKRDEAKAWEKKADDLREKIRHYQWNPALGVYNDTKPDGSPNDLITPAIFWPLWTGVATKEQARGILPYLADPKQLGSPWPLPSVAAGHPAYDPAGYWRGPTWINLNWVAIRGLQQYGFQREAEALRERTLDIVARTPILFEYYNSQTGEGLGCPHYGWTSALYIDLTLSP